MTDLGFVEGLRALLTGLHASEKPAQATGGTIAACIVVELVNIANVGDPSNFWDPADKWREISRELQSSWTEIETAYGKTRLDWTGDTASEFAAWYDKQLTPAQTALKALADELATQLDSVGGAILIMDIACVAFTVVFAAFMIALFAAWCATLGTITPALTAAGIAYIAGLVTWLGALIALIVAFVSATGALETKANDLAAALWQDSEKQEGARIAVDQDIKDSNNWTHNPTLDE